MYVVKDYGWHLTRTTSNNVNGQTSIRSYAILWELSQGVEKHDQDTDILVLFQSCSKTHALFLHVFFWHLRSSRFWPLFHGVYCKYSQLECTSLISLKYNWIKSLRRRHLGSRCNYGLGCSTLSCNTLVKLCQDGRAFCMYHVCKYRLCESPSYRLVACIADSGGAAAASSAPSILMITAFLSVFHRYATMLVGTVTK